jgi:hypothetical protein
MAEIVEICASKYCWMNNFADATPITAIAISEAAKLIECCVCLKNYHMVCCKSDDRRSSVADSEYEKMKELKSYVCSQKCINQYMLKDEKKNADTSEGIAKIMLRLASLELEVSNSRWQMVSSEEESGKDMCAIIERLDSIEQLMDDQDQGVSEVLDKLDILNQRSKKMRTHNIIIGRRINAMEVVIGLEKKEENGVGSVEPLTSTEISQSNVAVTNDAGMF